MKSDQMNENHRYIPYVATSPLMSRHEETAPEKSPSLPSEQSGSSPETSPETIKSKPKSKQYPNKPIIERQRRARMNEHLSEMKLLIMQELRDQPGRLSKLDKAELLEVAVRHLKREKQSAGGIKQDAYQHGYSECVWAVQQFLANSTQVDPDVRIRIMNHLAGRMHQTLETEAVNQSAPAMFSSPSITPFARPDANQNEPTKAINLGLTNSWQQMSNFQLKTEQPDIPNVSQFNGLACEGTTKIGACHSKSSSPINANNVQNTRTSPESKSFHGGVENCSGIGNTLHRPIPIMHFGGSSVMMGGIPGWGQSSFTPCNKVERNVLNMRSPVGRNCDIKKSSQNLDGNVHVQYSNTFN